ncbi:MAG: hypothetical protein EOM59_03240 [Clostridia bacterium]|nr:hypothetical protein [Clostridia bacterium]
MNAHLHKKIIPQVQIDRNSVLLLKGRPKMDNSLNKKSKEKVLISWLILLMIINLFPFGMAYGNEISQSVLLNLEVTVTQDGATIPEGGEITSTEPIRVDISFGVPVEGDNPTPANPVQKGDTVTLEIGDAFTVVPSGIIDLNMGLITVGHATFTTDPITNIVIATVTFDGDDSVFNGDSNTVTCQFGADFEYDDSGTAGNTGDHTVTILTKDYTVNVPALPIVYTVTKSGTANLAEQSITWNVAISATQGSTNVDLEGYQFFDNLQNVGDYITSAGFYVNGEDKGDVSTGSALSYVFPADSTSPAAIIFKTKIPDTKYYATSNQSISNNAQLLTGGSIVMAQGNRTVTFTPQWITKAGESSDAGSTGDYDPTDRTITWTITANQMEASLNNVVITDVLPAGLTFDHASWQTWNGSVWSTPATDITPSAIGGEYEIGNISSKILLTIISNVTNEGPTTGITTYSNSASISWTGSPGTVLSTGNINVGVGYNAISKSGVADTANQKIEWTVNVDTRGQDIPDLNVYDLLVYGNTINLSTVTGIPSITPTDLTPRYGQKYAGNFTGTGTCTASAIAIMQDGVQVADLLEITGLTTSAINTFSFDSQVVNPDIFAGNKTTTVYNTATLFNSNTKLNASTGSVNYINRLLLKTMLNRQAISDPQTGVNNLTTSLTSGFDYQEKSAIFRLNINADGLDLTNTTNAAGETLGTVTLTDTLPDGWEFIDIISGSGIKYLIFEGTRSGSTVLATDTTPDTVMGFDAIFNTTTAAFTFTSLNQPYVILVKARPTSDTAAQYFSINQPLLTKRNNVTLKTANWTTGVSTYQDVTITSQVLSKTTTRPTAGELLWTIDYKPYDLSQPGDRLEDTIPIGIDLRMDASGNLLLGENITVNEMTLNADGSYTTGPAITLVLDTNVSYDNSTRVLSFIIPDSSTAYRFNYLTDITGEPGTVTNNVSLIGGSTEQEDTSKPYLILSQDGSASLLRNGWIEITKTNASGTPLAGAEFTLYAMDGSTVIREGITNALGVLTLKVIPNGEYILRETVAPSPYALEGVDHSVVVTTVGTTVTSSIDGKTGTNPNKITIKNFTAGTVGNLTISKRVAGVGADTTKSFALTLTLIDAAGTYTYIGHGTPSGTITSGDTISLTHDQSITIVGIPKDATYTVTEENYSNDGYTAASTGTTGVIEADSTKAAEFINTRTVGNLTISKTVAGNAGDIAKLFDFTLTLNGATAIPYSYTGNGVSDGAIRSGDTISLTHDQSITIEGLPMGSTYTVTENDYSGDGYTTTSTGASGSIVTDTTQIAAFTNMKSVGNATYATISIIKKDTDGQKLAGATFALYSKSGNKLMTAVSDANGIALFTYVLKDTGYTIKETKAPVGFTLNTDVISFDVLTDSPQTYTVVNQKEVLAIGKITILKKDAAGSALGGAEFTLYDVDNKVVKAVVTKIDGTAEFADLPIGTYSVAETRAPLGYIGSDKRVNVEIVTGDAVVISFVNVKTLQTLGRFEVIKVDKEYRPLAGAEFTLYAQDSKEVGKVTTGSDGLAAFEGLQIGKYYVKETKAPSGYALKTSALNFEIKEVKTSISYTLVNTALEDEDVDEESDEYTWIQNSESVLGAISLPKTDGESTTLFAFLSGVCFLLFGLILL